MIGKKLAVGIIGTTAAVTVGVPVAIVAAQHASNKDSLDTKMQNKWADIEKELASSFGGFEIREKENVEKKQTQLSESADAIQKQQLLIQRLTGVGVPAYDANDKDGKTAFYNNLILEEKKVDQYISDFIDALQSIISQSANDYLFYRNSQITLRTVGNNIGINLSMETVDSKFKIKAISLGGANVIIPNEIDAFVTKEDDPRILAFDQTAVKVSLDKSQVKNFIYSSIATFKKAFDAVVDDSNILDIEQNVKVMLEQLNNTNSSLYRLIGDGSEGQNISSAFGLKRILANVVAANDTTKDFFGPKAAEIVTKIDQITEGLNTTLFETKLSVEGHHDKKLNDKYIKNLGEYKDGKGFISKAFNDSVLTPLQNDPNSIDQGLKDSIPDSFGTIDTSWFFSTLIKDDITTHLEPVRDQYEIIDNYIGNWNASHSGTMFTNSDAAQWQKESGNTKESIIHPDNSFEVVPVLGEDLLGLGIAFRGSKIKNMDSSDWLTRLQYELVWNSEKFESVVDKYNLSLNDLYVDIDTNDAHQEISNAADSKFTFNNVFLTPLVNAQNKPTLQTLYPLSSPEWVNAGYNIAQSIQATDIYTPGILAINALREFRLTQDTKITFRLKIENSEIGKIYENATNRKPLTFTLSKDGELSLDSRVGGNN